MDKNNEIKSVTLKVNANNDESLEIPLEVWQVEVIARMLGLTVKMPLDGTYEMASKDIVDEKMSIYYNACRKKHES